MEYNIYLKLTNGCNLKCKHCYNEIMMNHNKMNDNTLEDVIIFLKQFRNDHPNDVLNMSLHGGEPMTYDKKKILYIIEKTKDLNLKWCITTNLIYPLSDNDWKIFNLMIPFDSPMILTSWDYNIRFEGNQQQIWEDNVLEIMSKDIIVQPIVCLTNILINNITPKELFDYFENLGIKRLNFERITNTGRAVENNLRPLNKNLNEWLLNAYKEYEKRDLYIALFEGIEQSLEGHFLGCRARKCMEKVITINPDGSISACPNMANINYGNIKSIDIDKKQELINFEKKINAQCYICPYFIYCNGDCSQLQYDESGCPGMKLIYEYLVKKC